MKTQPTFALVLLYAVISLAMTPLSAQTGVRRFERGCGPVATWPRLDVTQGTPKIDTQMTLTGMLLAPTTMSITALGRSNTNFNGLQLPFLIDKAPFPPCQLLVSLDVLLFAPTTGSGQRAFSFKIPNDPRLVGSKVYLQMATAGAATHMTDGLELTIY